MTKRPSTQRGPKTTLWPLEDHTRAKHRLIESYLGAWFPILGTNSGRVVFLDAFAGPGEYEGGEYGSPVVALRTLLDHSHFGRLSNTEFLFLFVEPERDRCDNLEDVLADFVAERGGKLPKNVKYNVAQATFVDAANEILGVLQKQKKNLAPTFAFIDPFGVKNVPMTLIRDLLAFDRCELYINFMLDVVNRFAQAGNIDQHLDELYGTTEYKKAPKSGEPRREYLTSLYKQQLHDVVGFPYVSRFDMINTAGHLLYSLFHGTRHVRGITVMKDAMWRVDPGGGQRFSALLGDEQVLFSGEHVDVAPLRHSLLREFAGRTVTVEDVEEFVVVETPYKSSHYKKQVLKPLEQERIIAAQVSGNPRRGLTYPDGRTRITFPK